MRNTKLEVALYQKTCAVAGELARLIDLGIKYFQVVSGPTEEEDEPNRASEALLALENAREELKKAIECYQRPMQDEIMEIAKRLGFPTLETRRSDRLDFREVGVCQIKDALEAAYEAGRAAGNSGRGNDNSGPT